jgi:hypothetical protein
VNALRIALVELAECLRRADQLCFRPRHLSIIAVVALLGRDSSMR